MVIKTLEQHNPFSDFGKIIDENRFVGRKQAVKQIKSRVLSHYGGNLSIVGLPRIGKSSLLHNSLVIEKAAQLQNNIIIIRLSLSSFQNMHLVVSELCYKLLTHLNGITPKLHHLLEKEIESYLTYNKIASLEYFFEIIKEEGFTTICIMDEFDHAKNIFKIEDFQLLRELSINPATRITLVTASRQTIREIEPVDGSISNFHGVFSELCLGMFDAEETNEYWAKAESFGLQISQEYQKAVDDLVGAHPFWIDMVNHYVFNQLTLNSADSLKLVVDVKSSLQKNLYDHYDDILDLLEKEELKNHFFQIVVGPLFDATQKSIERLLKYGLINKKFYTSDANISLWKYDTISKHFFDYVEHIGGQYDVWPLWSRAEKNIRLIIKHFLEIEYGKEWEKGFLAKNPKRIEYIERYEDFRNKNTYKFTNASHHLVDYTYPLEMWTVFINPHWDWFRNVLKGKQTEWESNFHFMAKIRNPVAHSNQDFLTQVETEKAKYICTSINDFIDKWSCENSIYG